MGDFIRYMHFKFYESVGTSIRSSKLKYVNIKYSYSHHYAYRNGKKICIKQISNSSNVKCIDINAKC